MLNIIKSIVATMITLFVALISFLRGPLLIGLVVGMSIMVFAKDANAGEVYAPYQCNSAACPFWEAMSFSEAFGFTLVVIAIITTIILFLKDKKVVNNKPKSAFQADLDKALGN